MNTVLFDMSPSPLPIMHKIIWMLSYFALFFLLDQHWLEKYRFIDGITRLRNHIKGVSMVPFFAKKNSIDCKPVKLSLERLCIEGY